VSPVRPPTSLYGVVGEPGEAPPATWVGEPGVRATGVCTRPVHREDPQVKAVGQWSTRRPTEPADRLTQHWVTRSKPL